ncbi:MAG TPA: AAA family ATPase [Syntrophales bacterium]|nr:AAA family ATPase [Syntrophales bacterium]
MYYDYWGLKKPPFDNVPDPTMYAECHVSMENAIAETLFAIEEGNECVAVIVGDVGLGKTLSIRIIIDSLDPDKYKIALVTNPDMSFIELLREIIGQLIGKQCEERRKINLLEIFNKILFDTIDSGRKVLVFVDEANAMSPANLESLRLLTNMQEDQRNLFTIVLVGQLELARRLEHPKRANLFQRIGTFSRIDKIESEDLVKAYVETRLKLAGGLRPIFTNDAYGFLWEYSERGVPRLINKISKLSLKAGETNQFTQISGEVVHQIGERFRHLAGPAVQKRKPRKRVESDAMEESVDDKTLKASIDSSALSVEAFMDRRQTDDFHEEEKVETVEEIAESFTKEAEQEKEREFAEQVPAIEEMQETQTAAETAEEEPAPAAMPEPKAAAPAIKKEILEEMDVGGYRISINVPRHIVEQTQSTSHEHRIRVAGALAAQILKKHPELTTSSVDDPISIWSDIREFIANRLR